MIGIGIGAVVVGIGTGAVVGCFVVVVGVTTLGDDVGIIGTIGAIGVLVVAGELVPTGDAVPTGFDVTKGECVFQDSGGGLAVGELVVFVAAVGAFVTFVVVGVGTIGAIGVGPLVGEFVTYSLLGDSVGIAFSLLLKC